jgi:hypothetical protein
MHGFCNITVHVIEPGGEKDMYGMESFYPDHVLLLLSKISSQSGLRKAVKLTLVYSLVSTSFTYILTYI